MAHESEIIKLVIAIREQEKAIDRDKRMIDSGRDRINIAKLEKRLAGVNYQDPDIVGMRELYGCFLRHEKEAYDDLQVNLEILERNKATLDRALGI